MSTPGVLQLGYLRWRSPYVAAWRDIFARMAADVVDAPGSEVRAQLDSGQYRLAVEPGDVSSPVELGWEAAGPAEFEQLLEKLVRAGASAEVSPDLRQPRAVEDVARFSDCNGIVSELYWGRGGRPIGRVQPRVQQDVRFSSGRAGFGHVTYGVPDYNMTRDFYLQVLGMHVSDIGYIGGRKICFLSCNSRHHSFAFLETAEPCSLRHMMVEVESIDDLGIVRDRFLDAGASLERDLGRHATDGMLSFYVETPEGWLLEIGTDGYSARSGRVDRAGNDLARPWGHRRPA